MLIGIVGKPSSGKSTFLNAACLTNAKTANYPFTTIEPNLGTSHVRVNCVCTELGVKDNPKNSVCIGGIRYIPIKLLDVAGLVPDAHKGKGMGNKFLSDLSRADALIHVVDISGSLDAEGQDIADGSYDPYEDILFLEREIDYWFKDLIVKQDWPKFIRRIEQEKLTFIDMLEERLSGISVRRFQIHQAMKESNLNFEKVSNWSDEDILNFAKNLRRISKPILIAANKIDRPKSIEKFLEIQKKYPGKIIPCSALAEYWLRKFDQDGLISYQPGEDHFQIVQNDKLKDGEIKSLKNIQEKILANLKSTGIQNVINIAVFDVLKQIVVYPVYDMQTFSDKDGNILPDAHLVSQGTGLKEFVETKIHSELAKNFIYGVDARTKMRLGENYIVQDKDIIRIVSAAKGK
jgi:ribosome-binding ATPase YchF (GTP1/OBG family)